VSIRLLVKDAKSDCFSSAKWSDGECMRRLSTVQIVEAWIDRDLHYNTPAAQGLLGILTLQEKQIGGDILQDKIDSGTSLV
jgi:hypothetical protein